MVDALTLTSEDDEYVSVALDVYNTLQDMVQKLKMSITKNAFSLCGAIWTTPRLCLDILRPTMDPGKVAK